MISVIIPSYNRSKTIKRAVESVLSQTYRDLEVIVVDDCSSDDTDTVIKSINDDRLKYIKLDRNSGACVARNKGIVASKGELIAFQDSDDYWRPKKLEKQIQHLQENQVDVCFCRFERHNYGKNGSEIYPEVKYGIIDYEKLITESLVSTQTILVKREVFNSVLFDPVVKRRQDYDWVIRAAKTYTFYLCDEVLVDVYLQDDSITQLSAKKSCDTFIYLLNKYHDECVEYPAFEVELLRKIGYYKSLEGESAIDEYLRIYKIEKSVKSLIELILARFGLLKLRH